MRQFVITVTDLDGRLGPRLDGAAAVLLMTGHNITELGDGGIGQPIPAAWLRDARRRHREAAAHTGTEAFFDFLEYWARKEHDAELKLVVE